MSARWSLRKSGQFLTTLRVEHHVGRDDLIGAAAYALENTPDQVPQNPSQQWLLDNLRDKVWAYGASFDTIAYEAAGSDRWADAEAKVDGAFPDLRPEADQ